MLLLVVAARSARAETDPAVATALSVAPTVAGLGVILALEAMGAHNGDAHPAAIGGTAVGLAAVVVGPTLGHLYAGSPWSRGLKIRLVGLGLVGAGVTVVATAEPTSCPGVCFRPADLAALALVGQAS